MDIKCRNCRKVLIAPDSGIEVLKPHDSCDKIVALNCPSVTQPTSIYIDPDTTQNVEWIQKEIVDSEWSRGKLKCPGCQLAVGSFSFHNSTPCTCGKTQLPPLQLIVSKVDVRKDLQLITN